MNFLGYLVTLANLHSFAGGSPNDMSIRVGTLQSIADEVQNMPASLDGFRQNGYQRNGPIGVYISKNVQNYLFFNQGKPEDEGLMMTLYFNEDSKDSDVADNGRQTLFVHRQPVPDDVKHIINSYAQTGRWPDQAAANEDLNSDVTPLEYKTPLESP